MVAFFIRVETGSFRPILTLQLTEHVKAAIG
ncbi:hypothetical protein LZ22198_MCBDPFMK_00036 [Levilactobacillus zymae]